MERGALAKESKFWSFLPQRREYAEIRRGSVVYVAGAVFYWIPVLSCCNLLSHLTSHIKTAHHENASSAGNCYCI